MIFNILYIPSMYIPLYGFYELVYPISFEIIYRFHCVVGQLIDTFSNFSGIFFMNNKKYLTREENYENQNYQQFFLALRGVKLKLIPHKLNEFE